MLETIGSAAIRLNQAALVPLIDAGIGIGVGVDRGGALISRSGGARGGEVYTRSLFGTFVGTAADNETVAAGLASVAVSIQVGGAIRVKGALVSNLGFAARKKQ